MVPRRCNTHPIKQKIVNVATRPQSGVSKKYVDTCMDTGARRGKIKFPFHQQGVRHEMAAPAAPAVAPLPPSAPPDYSHCAIGVPSAALCIERWQLVACATLAVLLLVICGLLIFAYHRCSRSRKKGHQHDEGSSMRSDVAAGTPCAVVHARHPTPGALARSSTMPRCRSVERAIDEGRQRTGTDDALPDGWQEHSDADGNTYFFHLSDRRMSWTRPVCAPVVAASQQPALSHCAGRAVAIRGDAHRHLCCTTGISTVVAPPAGWEAQHDEESGCDYFTHAESCRTAWVPEAS